MAAVARKSRIPCRRRVRDVRRSNGKGDGKERATAGRVVTVEYEALERGSGTVLSSDKLTFEVGSSVALGNPIFKCVDDGVVDMKVGEQRELVTEVQEPWNPELLYTVPRDHQEILRLEGRYSSVGGLKENDVVELANGTNALVVAMKEESVVLDCNGPLSGHEGRLGLNITLVAIESEPSDSETPQEDSGV